MHGKSSFLSNLGYCDKVAQVVVKPATLLSEQFNWSHVIKQPIGS